jgi:CheY-like chemotaxis protein
MSVRNPMSCGLLPVPGSSACRQSLRYQLIIDDDDSVRAALRCLVRSMGFAVQSFATGREFLDSPYLGYTSCLILDINMPVMTGLDLYRYLSALESVRKLSFGLFYAKVRKTTRALLAA